MVILDVAGWGLFSGAPQFMQVLGDILKVLGGSLLIGFLAIGLFIGAIIRAVFAGIREQSLLHAGSTLFRLTTYGIGITVALFFVLVATALFSVSLLKVALIGLALVFVVAFIARETFLFLLLQRFGKYIFYLTTLHGAGKTIYTYVKTESSNPGETED